MSLVDDIKALQANLIPDNNNNEISPKDVRDSLDLILDNLQGLGSNYYGTITTSSSAITGIKEGGTVLPLEDGTYSNFGGLIRSEEFCVFVYESSMWSKKVIEGLDAIIDPIDVRLTEMEKILEDKGLKEIDESVTYMGYNFATDNFQVDFRNLGIYAEDLGVTTLDWGDGSPIIPDIKAAYDASDDNLKHTYAKAGDYEVLLCNLVNINNFIFRSINLNGNNRTHLKLGNTLESISNIAFQESILTEITFFSVIAPIVTGGVGNGMFDNSNITKIITHYDSVTSYVTQSWIDLNKDTVSLTFIERDSDVLYYDKIITVGTGGDYESLNTALIEASRFSASYKAGGLKVEVKILTGTIITDQVYVESIDMSNITITSEAYDPSIYVFDDVAEDIAKGVLVLPTVKVDTTGWTGVTHDTRGNACLFRAEDGGRLPKIGCIFERQTQGDKPNAGMCVNRGSWGLVKTLCGFKGWDDGIIANNESSITIREGIAMNCLRWACHARHNGEVSARSVIGTGSSTSADPDSATFYADRIAHLDVRKAWASNNVKAVRASNLSGVNCNGMFIVGTVTNTAEVAADNGGSINATVMDIEGNINFTVTNGATIIESNYPTATYSQVKNTLTSNGVIYG